MVDLQYVFVDSFNIERHTLSVDSQGCLRFVTGTELVKQNIIIYLNTLLKEFFYNENKGLDFVEMTDAQPAALSIYLMSALQDVRGVRSVLDCQVYDNKDRKYSVMASLETENDDYITIGYTV